MRRPSGAGKKALKRCESADNPMVFIATSPNPNVREVCILGLCLLGQAVPSILLFRSFISPSARRLRFPSRRRFFSTYSYIIAYIIVTQNPLAGQAHHQLAT